LHINTKAYKKYVSFLKTDIQLVYNFLQNNQLIPYNNYNRFLLETIENILETNINDKIDTG